VTSDRVLLGGFSQGSMLALDVALHDSRPLAGLALLSTTPLCLSEWQPLMAARRDLPVLQTHGTQDVVLPHALALEERDLLEAAGLDVTWISFPGGHELPPLVLNALADFIAMLLPIPEETNR
jgi:phospholipase/carboxylesterase